MASIKQQIESWATPKKFEVMKAKVNTTAPVVVPGLDWLFAWLDRHPHTAAVLLWLQVAAILYAVITYNFTTL